MAKVKPSIKPGCGWAYEFAGRLCNWAEPTRKTLMAGGTPSKEAVPVYVRIIPMRDAQRMGSPVPRAKANPGYEIRVRTSASGDLSYWGLWQSNGRLCGRFMKAAACRASARRFSKATGIAIEEAK